MAGAKWRDVFEKQGKKYVVKPEMREVLTAWAQKGLTRQEIADRLEISRSTLSEWEKKYPDISDALKNARAYADARVENALFKKAVGYTFIKKVPMLKKTVEYKEGKRVRESQEVEIVEVEEHVPPEMGAIAFYLKNRLWKEYKDKWIDIPDDEQERAGMLCMKVLSEAIMAQQEKGEKRGGHPAEQQG